ELDMLVANGETITAPLVAMCLQGMGVPAVSLSGAQAGVRTSEHHSRARIRDIKPDRIMEALRKHQVPVVAGFQGVTEELEITTLGRGGSDPTAVALAAALRAESCEIYTDVDGIFTADPRVVKSARKLSHIQYDEMLELAAVGARVMHPRAVEIGELYSVPIHVRSSFRHGVGTMIVAQVPMEDRQRVRGIAQETNVAKITVVGVRDRPGVAAAIFEPLGAAGISVDVIVQNIGRSGHTDLTFSVAESDLKAAEKLVKVAAKSVGATRVSSAAGIAKLSIVGTGMLGAPGIAARMFRALADAGVNIEMISTSAKVTAAQVRVEDSPPGSRAQRVAFARQADVLLKVARCFGPAPDPAADLEEFALDLVLADLASVEKRLEVVAKEARAGKKDAQAETDVLNSAKQHLDAGQQLRTMTLEPDQRAMLLGIFPVTLKPAVYVANVAEELLPDGGEPASKVK